MRFTISYNETGHLACLCLRWLRIWFSLVPRWVTNIVVRTWKVTWRVPLGSMTAVWQYLMAPHDQMQERERGRCEASEVISETGIDLQAIDPALLAYQECRLQLPSLAGRFLILPT